MDDVVVGAGSLAGKGVYASRDFAAGEVVVAYQLAPLTSAEYEALPESDRLFVHSYGGCRYRYPEPACFVNHSDDPSCYQDFERGCDVALRPIAENDAITIDAGRETDRELTTFLDAYVDALRGGSAEDLGYLIDDAAVLWLPERTYRGRAAGVVALIGGGPVTLTRVTWMVGTGRWEAVCSARSNPTAAHSGM